MTRCESLLPLSKSLFYRRKESVQQEVPQVLIKYAFREVRAEIARPFCREFTTIKRRERLLERFLKRSIVELLTLRANCPLFTSKAAHSSCYLPVGPQVERPGVGVFKAGVDIAQHEPSSIQDVVDWGRVLLPHAAPRGRKPQERAEGSAERNPPSCCALIEPTVKGGNHVFDDPHPETGRSKSPQDMYDQASISSIERSFLVTTGIKNQNLSFSPILKNLHFLIQASGYLKGQRV